MKIFYNPKVSEDNKTVHAKSSKAANSIYDFLQTFFYMTAIVVLAMVFVVRPVSVDGRSMNPTLWDKDIMLVTNYYSAPKTGDIVIITHGKIVGNGVIPEVVPKGKLFVMGDNREHSTDSRFTEVGLIDYDDIIGRARVVLFPFKHLKLLPDVEY